MEFAVNYSKPAERMWRSGEIAFDRFKLPDWPDVVDQISAHSPCYIHFPYNITDGRGSIFDFDRKKGFDIQRTKDFLLQTHTPLVNVHLGPQPEHYPDLNPKDLSLSTQHKLIDGMARDLQALCDIFGADKVIAENDSGGDATLAAALLPNVIRAAIEQAGCGFLFDFSHARIAARRFGRDAKEYIAELPTERLREVHITGIQYFDQRWQDRLIAFGADQKSVARHADRWMDHLPLTDADWQFTAWALDQIHSGAWREPWVLSCEYGGVGGFFEATMDEEVIRSQFPRLNQMIKKDKP